MLHAYEEAVEWIHSLIPFGIKPGLKRMEALMEAFGRPERRLKVIHVAGTNGKGSTCRMIAQVLQQSGYDVGSFTSPYIERFTNRIQYNGQDIADDDVLHLANQLQPVVEQIAQTELGSPTMFEVVTALSILYFAKHTYPHYVVMETGLGGRLDSTNVVIPIVTAITNVGMDHMDILGDTLTQIASEKAGIIKPGVPLVSTAEHPEVIRVLKSVAAEKKSSCYFIHDAFHTSGATSSEAGSAFHFSGPFRDIPNLQLSMKGSFQVKNAAAAVMVLEVLRQYYAAVIEDEDLHQGLKEAFWPGRMEMLSADPPLLIDGAHNPEGAQALVQAIQELYPDRNVHFLFGMLDTKNHREYLTHILPIVKTLIITEPDFRKKMQAEALARMVETFPEAAHIDVQVEPDWKKALSELMNITEEEDLAVVSGTLYLISDIRSWVLHHSESEKGW
ncbi:bifunctional folylpolyglutamate synthase/dihydrofolate synthase [Marinicrinis sediminis]|uniref:tetrahydrofolate synthase n=1 Tax=Marinicrinis sediminis TaxID=1652465 RepID=A0ABW5R7B6_9BACL